jgi:hypothetical protein
MKSINFVFKYKKATSLAEALMIMLIISLTMVGSMNIMNTGIVELKSLESINQNQQIILNSLEYLRSSKFSFQEGFDINTLNRNQESFFILKENLTDSSTIILNNLDTINVQNYTCKDDDIMFNTGCAILKIKGFDNRSQKYVAEIHGVSLGGRLSKSELITYMLTI